MNNLDYTKINSYQPYSPIFVRGYYIRKEVVSAGKLAQKKIAIVFQNINVLKHNLHHPQNRNNYCFVVQKV